MKISTADKLQRLISIVSWVHDQGAPTLDEICERFSIGRDELVSQLDMASLVGEETGDLGDMPIELYYEDDRVHLYLTAFQRPLRLTPEQALALLTAAAGVLQLDPTERNGPLSRAVTKLAAALGVDPTETVEVDLGSVDADLIELLRRATSEHRPIALRYWSAGRDQHSERTVEPWQVFNEAGAWYLQARCRNAEDERVFRIDRISAAALDEAGNFEPPSPLPTPTAYRAAVDEPRMTLDLSPEARWVASAYPIDSAEEMPGGGIRVTMPAGAPAFMARLLLRLGPEVVLADEGSRSVGSDTAVDAARLILDRYRASDP